MFRKMLRSRQELSRDECIRILEQEPRGVLAVLGDEDYPYAMPMNHWYCPEDGKLYFHGGMQGHKLDALRRHDKLSFCVYDQGWREQGDWALHIRSVIVFGRVEFIDDRERTLEISRALSRKFTQDEGYIEREVRMAGARTLCFALCPEHISGKAVKES